MTSYPSDAKDGFKQCNSCNKILPLDSFYKQKTVSDGHQGRCKQCVQNWEGMPENKERRTKRYNEYKQRNLSRIRKRCRDYQKRVRIERPEITAIRDRERSVKYRVQKDAVNKANKAVALGIIPRQKHCSSCGKSGRIEKHHPDYKKPLEVIWLCSVCHRALHFGKLATINKYKGE